MEEEEAEASLMTEGEVDQETAIEVMEETDREEGAEAVEVDLMKMGDQRS